MSKENILRIQNKNLYYYIKHLRIGGSIFCHGKFLLYPFYPSIRRIIFIVGWSNVCDRVHWSPLSLHFFPLYTIISIIFVFYLATLCIFGKELMMIIYVRIIYFSFHKNHESLTHIVQKSHPRLNIVFIICFLYNLVNL